MSESRTELGWPENGPSRLSAGFWSSFAAVAVVWLLRVAVQLGLEGSAVSVTVNNAFDAAVPLLVAGVIAWCARRTRPFRSRRAGAWSLLALAYLSYAFGQVAFDELGGGLGPGPASYLSTFLNVVFYGLFLAGVLRLPSVPLAARERVKVLLETGVVLCAAGLIQWLLLVGPLVNRPDVSLHREVTTIAFQLGDLMALWALIELLLRRRDPSTQAVYSLLAMAAGFLIVTDVIWGRQVLGLDTTFGWLLGPGWAASHLLAGLAAVRSLGASRGESREIQVPAQQTGPRASLYLAYASGAAAFIVASFDYLRNATVVVPLLVVGMVSLVVLRQVLGLRENAALWRRLRSSHDELEGKVRERTAELHGANVELQGEIDRRRRAQEETQRRVRELTVLRAATEMALEAKDESELFAGVTRAIRETLYPDNCGFLLVAEAERTLRHGPGFHSMAPPEAFRDIPLGEGITGSVALSGVPRRVADTAGAPDYIACDPAMRSEVCVPVRAGDRVVGVLDAESSRIDAFTEDDERVLGMVANQVAAGIGRLRASEAVCQSERNYREVFNATSEAILVHDAVTGAVLDVNQTMLDMYGTTRAEALRASIDELSGQPVSVLQQDGGARIRKAIEEGPQAFEWLAKRKDGSEFWVEVTLRSSRIGGEDRVLAVVRDIGERRRAEEALRLSEERFRAMVQQAYDFVTVLDARGNVVYESPSTDRILGYGPGGLTGRNGLALIHPDDLAPVQQALARLAREGSSGRATLYRVRRADGSWIHVESLGNNLLDNPAVRGIVLTSRDVSERVRTEEDLRRKVAELTVLNAVAEIAAGTEDEDLLIARTTEVVRNALFPDDCGVLMVDDAAGVLRYTSSYRQGVTGLNREPIPLSAGITGLVVVTGTAYRTGDVSRVPQYVGRLKGMRSEVCVPMKAGNRVIGVVNAESARPDAFSEHDESVLGTIAGQLATAIGRLRAWAAHRESEDRFRRLADAAFEGIGITDQGRIIDANRRLAEILGYEPAELIGRDVMDFVAPEAARDFEHFMRQGKDDLYEHLAMRKDGSIFPVETQGRQLTGSGTMRVAAVRDITERKRAAQRIQHQLERLAALRAIDAAIAGGFDLPETLDLFLAHLLAQLHLDAADVLVFEPSSNLLAFAAGKGFRSDEVRGTRLGPGECYAGLAARERRTIAVPDLVGKPDGPARASLVAKEGFTVCFVAPLVAKGHVHGVLEAFRRKPLEPDGEWLDYLDTLAGQLAIAIDNRTMFEDLQRSNTELAQAYDTTLEGWSRALELRDRETHGHTARVVEKTVRLAGVMGVPPRDLVHVRRGALLHDIGKMAIPDAILLKPGPLDEEEWRVMRRHPEFAYDLLKPIGFLRTAVDIPYCHHERWDGTGYPRGLSGEDIPLAARIFAVIDSWDALCYPRPYREAWTGERVRAYLRDEAGRRFDPAIVEAFLGMSD